MLILEFDFNLDFSPDSCPIHYFSSLDQLTRKDQSNLIHLIESSDVSSTNFHINDHFSLNFKAIIIFVRYFKYLSEAPNIKELTLLLIVMERPQVFSHSLFEVSS